MRYAQIRLPDKEFIKVKKAALDAGMTLEEFMKSAIFEKMFADVIKQEECSTTNPQS